MQIGAGEPAAATWITTIRQFFMPRFAERVKAETNYEIQWTEAWGGSACKLGECLEAVEAGLLEMADLRTLTFQEKKDWAAHLPNIPKERYEEMEKLGQPGEAICH